MPTVLAYLKQTKNSLIGNPTAKLALQREGAISTIVDYLNIEPLSPECSGESATEIRTQAAHIIASLAYGSPGTLSSLLAAGSHEAILWAISSLQPADSLALKTALTKALKALVAAYADVVGPSLWGLEDENCDLRSETRPALDCLFETQALDVYLPLLTDPSVPIKIAICQLLASSLRIPEHRTAVTDWVPISERVTETKGKRGWEKPNVVNAKSSDRLGGWLSRILTAMLQARDIKLQEAALLALAALTKDNPSISTSVSKSNLNPEASWALTTALTLSKSRHSNLQLAACLCAARMIPANLNVPSNLTLSWTLLHVLNGIIANTQESSEVRTKACFILYALVNDDKELCRAAVKSDSPAKLSDLLKSITLTDGFRDWGDGEPESVSRLREAAMTCLAALALFDNEMRHNITSSYCLIPVISICLSHPRVGVRYAACQCIRAISRAVAVLRTSIVDTGVGLALYELVEKREEDRRVTAASLAGISNLVNNFSPVRASLISRGLIPRLAELVLSPYPLLKLNAVWAVRSLMYKCTTEEKESILGRLGWDTLCLLLNDPDAAVQEQALTVMRNIASCTADIDMMFNRMGADRVIDAIKHGLESPNEDVLGQALFALANIANGNAFQRACILSNPQILRYLRAGLTHSKLEARQAAVSCVKTLAQVVPHQHKELREAGIDSTLRHIIVGSGTLMALPPSPISGGHLMGLEEDRDVRNAARAALHTLEHPDDLSM